MSLLVSLGLAFIAISVSWTVFGYIISRSDRRSPDGQGIMDILWVFAFVFPSTLMAVGGVLLLMFAIHWIVGLGVIATVLCMASYGYWKQ